MVDQSLNAPGETWRRYWEWIDAHFAADNVSPSADARQSFYGNLSASFDDSKYEARLWMQNPAVEALLAVNRFRNAEGGRAFIEHLYALGATRVYVTDIDCRQTTLHLGIVHANQVMVTLPDEPAARRALGTTFAAEALREGYGDLDAEMEMFMVNPENTEIGFWWD